MQDYKFMCAVVTICGTMVDIKLYLFSLLTTVALKIDQI